MGRSYDQYCPLARALDVVGDRWTMLILRELFLSPKRFTDLQLRLQGVAPNLLSSRLKDLQSEGLISRRTLDRPAAIAVYELTDLGRGLNTAMSELARWGVQFLGTYEKDEAFNIEWLVPVLDEVADREAARGCWEVYEFHIGDSRMWVGVSDGEVSVRAGTAPGPADLVVETDLETFVGLGFESISPEDAWRNDRLRVIGDVDIARRALAILSPARIFSRLATVSRV